MGYSSKASLLAAVEGIGEIDGIKDFNDKLTNWRFTERCRKTEKKRDIRQERIWLNSVKKELRRVK